MIEINGVKYIPHYWLIYNGPYSCGLPVLAWLERWED